MAQSNHERVGRALELLNMGFYPFVEQRMQATYGTRWLDEVRSNLLDHQVAALQRKDPRTGMDTQILLIIVWDYWNAVFKNALGHAERTLISELRDARNKWAHQEAFSTDDAYRTLDSIQRLLTAVSAGQQASEVERQKHELIRLSYENQTRQETRKMNIAPLEGKPTGGLLPWRSVVTPHPDVTSGRYQVAEFAADLGQVHRGEGSDEYLHPRDFFQRTYLTHGLRQLLIRSLQRLSGKGGDPVIDLQTNFGGGKTHSLLALYHLYSGASLSDLLGIEPLLTEAGLTRPLQAQRVVLVGHELSPAQPRPKPDGCVINTLWGELAWQLLGKDGYAMVAESDRSGVNPGSIILRELFAAAAPCLILIDELVVYIQQLYHLSHLPGGSFDANLSFVQSLTEAAKTPQTLLVVTISASETERAGTTDKTSTSLLSDSEAGGEGGREATFCLKRIFGRVESPWRPADAEEGFEIVRRRLFQDIRDMALFTARDTVARAFVDFYQRHPQEFPAACCERRYEERIKRAYPIHPELFDRLYNDWSSIEKFQRTRGVLRLMAKVVHNLWLHEDKSLLILPASIPISDGEIKAEFANYLENNWDPIIEKDIDGTHSLSWRLDADNPTLGRYSTCRRVARSIFLGSAPNPRTTNKGLTETSIKLGCLQAGETLATFGDALRRLSDQSSYLYLDGRRYWYGTYPTVTRLAQDRATQYSKDEVSLELEKRLRSEQSTRGDFARVHVCPTSSGDVADDDPAARLVILRPSVAHARNDKQSSAWQEAERLLNTRGNSPRNNKNTLVFLAADRTRLEELKSGVCQYLAWDSIVQESDLWNLDAFGRNQAQTKRNDADTIVKVRIPETYCWLLIPIQEKLQPLTLEDQRLQAQSQPPLPLATPVSRRLKTEDFLIPQYAATFLRSQLDEVPLWRGNHLAVKTLAHYFAQHVYLPRLKNSEVLLATICEGVQSPNWQRETFAYAESWDEDRQRYLGLKAGQAITLTTATGLVVKSEVAAAQLAAEAAEQARKRAEQEVDRERQVPSPGISSGTVASPAKEVLKHRFHGAIKINPRMMASDAAKIMTEVVQHLTSLSKDGVTVTLEIQACLPDGIPVDIQQVVQENCHTLHFETAGFEEE